MPAPLRLTVPPLVSDRSVLLVTNSSALLPGLTLNAPTKRPCPGAEATTSHSPARRGTLWRDRQAAHSGVCSGAVFAM